MNRDEEESTRKAFQSSREACWPKAFWVLSNSHSVKSFIVARKLGTTRKTHSREECLCRVEAMKRNLTLVKMPVQQPWLGADRLLLLLISSSKGAKLSSWLKYRLILILFCVWQQARGDRRWRPLSWHFRGDIKTRPSAQVYSNTGECPRIKW